MKIALLSFVAMHAFACTALDRDRILAADFVAAHAAFATLDAKLELAAAPVPGITRTFTAEEIARLARAHSLTLATPAVEICFERATQPLSVDQLLPVLRAALNMNDASVEVLDFAHTGVPRGTLQFSKSGLSAAGIWRGRVLYDTAKSMPIWAKVRVTVERTWVEAAQPIATGELIDAARLTLRTGPRFPFGVAPVDSLDRAINRKSLRAIRAGEPIFASMLTSPREIERGDSVRVNVSSGGALLEFDAVAQSSAHTGELVLIRNPENNRLFQARVDAKGKVSVIK